VEEEVEAPPTGPSPVPSPIGRGVECEIPPIISELAVIARSEVWRQGGSHHKR